MYYSTDIVIIGAGAVGTAIARELSKYHVRVMVVDKRDDVGGDASKSNSSIICSGFDCPPDTLESQLCLSERAMIEQVVKELDVPFRVCGAIMPAVTQQQMDILPHIYEDAYANHVYDVEYVSPEQILKMEPEINPDVLGGLYIPRDAVIDPFLLVVAQAENAAENGVQFLLNTRVVGISVEHGQVQAVETTGGTIRTKYVINAAGLFCDEIAKMVDECDGFVVKPRKGQFFILDKNTPCKTSHIVYPIPTPETRGKLLLQTIHGNMLLGPTAEDLEDKEDHSVTAEELEGVERDCKKLVPNIRVQDTITQYCGLRPNRIPAGFHIGFGKKTQGYFGISGIRSTGISTSLAIAKYVVKQFQDAGVKLERSFTFQPRRTGIEKFSEASDPRRAELIAKNPLYGRVICRCETVTEAEIVEAIHRPVGARTVDAVKRRVRAGTGRCQGGFCGPKVIEILARELRIPASEIEKNLAGSYMLTGQIRGEGEQGNA
ncbi:MAG: NAD(P)/FAD-dependent oxidoreductase [Oscillibacter sp.]|nr:NAD(P)/FAD-dependent oxidoreductase [Oscillibacter sp.]